MTEVINKEAVIVQHPGSPTMDPEFNRILAQREDAMGDTPLFIETIFEPDQVIEVRVIRGKDDIRSGFYTDRVKLFQDIDKQDLDTTVKGIYVVLNKIDQNILRERSPAQINNIARGKATSKENILRRRWIVLDFDPVKATTEANSSSTDAEKAETFERAKRCEDFLTANGFPEPIRGDSGNGAHRIYRIDLPNDDKSYDLIAAVLAALNAKFSIDVIMKDAPRISKLYGTTARKGTSTAERPHRVSRLISVPDNVHIVTADMLRKVAEPEIQTGYITIPIKKVPVTVKEGTITMRHTDGLKPMITSMVARKNSQAVIMAACQEMNRTQFSPPKGEQELIDEVNGLIKWALEQEAKKASANDNMMQIVMAAAKEGQKGISNLFMKEFTGQFVFDHSEARWYEFTGHSWQEDLIGKPLRSVTKIQEYFNQALMMLAMKISDISAEIGSAEKILKDTAGLDDDDKPDLEDLKNKKKKVVSHKTIIEKAQQFLDTLYYRKQIVEFSALGEGSLGISGSEWDADPWLLGCKNGVLDLKTGQLRDGTPEDYIRNSIPTTFDKNAKCPKFVKFLTEICSDDNETVEFLQRFFGMGLLGDARLKQFVLILSGVGRNGKDTLTGTINRTLGNKVAGVIVQEMLMNSHVGKSSGSAASDVMDLRGKRILVASETKAGAGFDMQKVKLLSGGGDQKGRVPYGKSEVQFHASHVLVLMTNNLPVADAGDYAFWQRIKCVNFKLSYPENFDEKTAKTNERKPNINLGAELESELPGILNWLVEGCLSYQKNGLKDPVQVRTATDGYKEEVDVIGTFITEQCVVKKDQTCRAGELYGQYKHWAITSGLKPWNLTRFGTDFGKRYTKGTDKEGTFYTGIGLRLIDYSMDQNTRGKWP